MVLPYGFVVLSGKSSVIGTVFGEPYTVAEELKITQQQVTRYENNYRKFKQDFLFKLADYFQVSINDFFPLTTEELNTLNEYDVLFNKYKELSEEDKELINNIIDTRTKQIDKELDKS